MSYMANLWFLQRKKLAHKKKTCERVDLFAEHGFLQQHVDAHQLRVNGLEKAKLTVLNLTGHLVAGVEEQKISLFQQSQVGNGNMRQQSHLNTT